MKLTKKLEAEILKVYKTYWEAYLMGDMKTFASYLADDITVFGTAVSEIFNNKKETLRFYKETADQMVGKAQFRSRSIKMRAVDENILLNEQCDCYVLIEGKWTFYGHTRISSILKQTNSGWKLAHQHASFPDTRADEGEQVATKKIKEENLQLRDAVKRRTIELEEKNRELEIEAAVERVRAKALAMHSSEEIREVVRTLRNELFGLKLTGVTAVTICLKQDDGRVRFWDITDLETTGRFSADITFDMAQTDPRFYLRKIWSSKKKIIAFEQDSNDLKRTLKWLSQYDKKTAAEITELIRVNKIKRGWHRAVKLANGRLITDFINEPPAEIEFILLKMGAAFDLAYKRFLDLKNAEEQTKEARVELALERVRARAMAMHNSNELAELVSTVFNELTQLDFKLTSCIIWIHDHENTKNTLWIASTEMNKPAKPFLVNVFHNDFFKSISHAWKSKDTKWVYTFTGKEKKNFEKAFFKEIPQLPIPLKNALKVPEQVVFSASFNNFGALEIVETEALTEEKFEILHRFGKVFDSSYTRFNDLKKAEAQARDARIETGLERVRSKTMAMHKSEEVTGIAVSLNEELLKLGFEGGSTIIIIDKKTGDTEQWTGFSEDKTLKSCNVPYFKHPCHDALLDTWKRDEKFLAYTLIGNEKKTFDEHYFATGYKHFPESDKKWMRQMGSVTFSYAFMKYGAIHWGPGHLTAEQLEILQRFSKVFEQSYTRFLDLQKAESQAREAKIEVSLERIRAKAMAMHLTDELTDVLSVLFEQFDVLGIGPMYAHLNLFNLENNTFSFRCTGKAGQRIIAEQIVALDAMDNWKEVIENFKNGKPDSVNCHEYPKEILSKTFELFKEIRDAMPQEARVNEEDFPNGLFVTQGFCKFGYIGFGHNRPATEEEKEIVKKFATEFGRLYQRFLDLQKAEAQAREAQIESALERVRSKTMAMYRSEELDTVIKTVYAELKHLDVSFKRCFIMIFDEQKGATWWMGSPDDDLFHQGFYVQYHTHPPHLAYLKGWEERQQKWEYWLKGQIKKDWDEFVFNETELAQLPPIVIHDMKSFDFAYLAASFENFGCMTTGGIERLSEESFSILRRFAKVFDQTYTRFKDLKQAESQAREAQIEAALERVRSRSMAMHKSDDLHEVIKVVTEQLSALSLKFNAANFAKIDPDGSWDLWLSTPEQAYPAIIHVPYLDHPIFNDITEQIAKNNDFYTRVYNQEEANIFFHHFFENTIAKNTAEERKRFVYNSKGFARSLFLTKNIWFSVSRYDSICFSDEENAIFKRFANVFEQAYTRFLDLQKAEAQAREADIELSLERVRAKTMAMQKPAEFLDVINEIGEQFVHLDFDIEWVNFGANGLDISEGIDIWNFAVIPGSPPISARLFIPYFDHPQFINAVEELDKYRRTGNDFFITALNKDDKDSWLDHLFTKTIFKDIPEEYRAIQYAKPGYTTSNIALKDTWLSIGKLDLKNFTDEQHGILRRFAKAFGQAYTRFLDLQKAEAQAKEAQIEASLERVRSRAMAMQNSDELKELIGTVFTELTKLDIVLTRCLIMIYDPRSNDSVWWMANSEAPTEPIGLRIQNHGHPPYTAYLKAWEEKKLNWVYVLEGAVKKDWDDFLFVETELSHLPDFVIAGMKAPERVYLNSSFNSFGNLTLASLEPLSNEHFDILLRFAKVFDLTYTRFNDLKQAEAQAKEAKIEAALERVRSRSMAMHSPQELKEVALEMRNQLGLLEQPELEVCAIHLYEESPEYFEAWAALRPPGDKGKIIQVQAQFPKKGVKIVDEMFLQYEAGTQDYILINEGEKVPEWLNVLKEHTPEGYKMVVQSFKGRRPEDTRAYWSMADFKGGSLIMTTYIPPSNDARKLLRRFANVFGLAYRRFIDLKNAETQKREAQIELALERVRARTMAMHKSEELAETAQVLFQQLSELGGIPDRIAIGITDETNGVVNFWTTDQQGSHLDHSFSARLNERTTIVKTYQAWKEQKRSLVVDLHGEELKEWIQFAREEMGIAVKHDQIKDRRVHTMAFFSHGWILVTSHEPQSPDTIQILERFASVFNLTYRRFLDLQKAETQANEARIEIALERIRARALAMHKSDELMEVAKVLREQMAILGQPELEASVVHLYEEDPDHILSWRAFRPTDSHDKIAYGHMSLPKNSCEFVREWLTKFYGDEKEYTIELSGAKQDEWYDLFFKFAPDVINSMHQDNSIHDKRYYRFSKFSGGALLMISKQQPSEEATYLQKRAAVVFDLAYRRFSDLQKAEAQAREAQIETALEKIRSRSLAMHKSDELQDVVNTVFERLKDLDIEADSSNIAIFKKGSRNFDYWIASDTQKRSASFHMPYIDLSLTKDLVAARENGLDFSTKSYPFEVKNEWFDFAFKETDFKFLSEERKQFILNAPGITIGIAFSKHTGVQVNRYSDKLLSEGEGEVLKRFSKVFEQAYIRFLDLEKAEAQARESQIEASLERVRSKTMAMHKSEELLDIIIVISEQLQQLNIKFGNVSFGVNNKNYDLQLWMAVKRYPKAYHIHWTFLDNPGVTRLKEAQQEPEKVYSDVLTQAENNEWLQHIFNCNPALDIFSEEARNKLLNSRGYARSIAVMKDIFLVMGNYAAIPYTDDENNILKRFANVFEQAYKRFLDLQKAEANAREALIEAGLERVRAKAMAMHSSKDLAETLSVFYRELKSLSVVPIRCGVALMDKESRMAELITMNTTGAGDSIEIMGKIKMTGHPVLDGVFESWLVQKEYHAVLRGNQIKEYYQVLKPQIDYLDYPHDEVQFGYYFMFNEGDVYAWTEKELTEDELTIYRRFTTVISLTYKRYKDLQQAEAQAREATIEAGLERVRARTMAMHSSEDVGAATATMFTELEKLGIQNLRGGITIIRSDQTQEVWGVTNLGDGRTMRTIGIFDMRLHPFWQEVFKGWEAKEDYKYYWLAGKDKEDYINILNATPNYLAQPIKEFPDVHVQTYFFGEGAIWTNSLEPHTEEQKQTMKRFASVFSLTFRRYQDLRKAEAQAREATIEAALERVRGKAMAMHSSKDLATTIGVFYHELEGLNLTPRRCGVGLIDKETWTAEISTMNATADGEGIELVGVLDMRRHPVLTGVYNSWLTKTEYHPVLRGNEIKEYYQLVRPQVNFPDYPNDTVQYGYFFFFEEGGVYAWTEKELNEDELKIYRRFTSVLSLTYKRYKDLKDAEARTQAAIKDAALDRIRADIASMRTVNDLDRITPLIWNELTVLGIPFIRCGVFIMDEEQQLLHTFLSTPDGKAIAAFHLPYDTPGPISKVIDGWRHRKIYKDHWAEEEFVQFADILMKQGALNSREQYLKTIPHGGFYLHFLPFLQGMLYVGNTTQLGKEEIELIQHVADAFSTAYARYEDFNKLEAAKQTVEKTLTDLKQAQTQLVQSEKMASLGELTAGIAHEIQNPLNFVNNFSDVSSELLEEMKVELEKGNKEDAIAIVEDVKQNLEKILHHGKRADAIVKGMLQHSRTSSGQKEPTDINNLADEYLRLAFHGLRAKDKSFNAKFETEFDNSIEKINIIPQDIGRVILNLINNAFYAVTEKKKVNSNGYEPVVTVTTKKDINKIEIKVKDNGNGIPQKALDKIFQPFFTTKPTGQGTGLGLSLAYDIVTKGHGGELKVETKEGEGSEFIIQLPVS